jgi:hypothetical protein
MKTNYLKQPVAMKILLQSFFAVLLVFSACKKTENAKIEEATKVSGKTKVSILSVNPTSNANAVFDGFCRAFLVRGSNTFITASISDRGSEYFWGQGFCITAMIDAYEKNPTADRKQIVIDLCNSFLDREGTDWSWNDWDDDIEWCLIPLSRAYLITGNTRFRDAAVKNLNFVYDRGWSGDLGGGIWERMDYDSKCALSNSPFIIAGTYLYKGTNDATILNKCKAVYAWERSHILNTSDWHVSEGVKHTGALIESDNAWNNGSFINAAAALYGITNDVNYLNDAKNVANHVINKWPILSVEGDACFRGIARLARENRLGDTYYPWLANNCVAAWSKRRTDYNITNNNFTVQTSTANIRCMEAVSSLTVQMVTNEYGSTIANGTYKIINRANGQALDAVGGATANGTAIDAWGYNGGNNQRWTITSLGSGLYKLIGVGSNRSVNISGSSQNNGAPCVLWDYQNTLNEVFYLSSPANGYWSLIFPHSNKALDLNTTTNKVGQWDQNGGNNQQWQFVAP